MAKQKKKRYGIKQKRLYFGVTVALAVILGGILTPAVGLLFAAYRVARRPWDPLF